MSDTKRDDGGPAFPVPYQKQDNGVSLRDYFIAHAPAEPQFWFKPVMETERPKPGELVDGSWPENIEEIREWDGERDKQRYIQWPAAWADAMLEARHK